MKRLAFLLTLLIPFFALSQIINIPDDYPTIQEGIDIAHNGDTVLVDTGTYYENINFIGKAITVASHYLLNPDSTYINNTIIDGSQPSHPDSASVVMFVNGEDTTSVLCGFTITKGTGFMYPSVYIKGGGGIVGMASGAKITNNIIINNSLENENEEDGAGGGGISFLGGTSSQWVLITDNTIKSNQVSDPSNAYGGGIYTSLNSLVERNRIENNACYSIDGRAEGGGIEFQDVFSNGFQLILTNNIIRNNLLSGKYTMGGGLLHFTGFEVAFLKENFTDKTTYRPPTAKTQIVGNFINNNSIIGSMYEYGAGIQITRPVTEINIFANEISYNNCSDNQYSYGGGIYLVYAENNKLLINGNLVIENEAEDGGGCFFQNSYNMYITNNLFQSNSAGSNGGAIRIHQYNGKATSNKDYIPTISNNTFVDNTAEIGGAVFIKSDPYIPIINNSIFWNNTTPSGNGNDLSIAVSSSVTLNYNEIDIIAIEGDWTGDGNMFENPNFVGSGDHPFQINDNSPCIDAGTPDTTGLNLPEYDIAGEVRVFNERVDMGAYEWNTYVGIEDASMPEQDILQVNSYPNPFSTSTTIEYELDHPETVKIIFYNQFGKQVDVIEESQQKGLNRIEWTPKNLADGIYYFRLVVGQQVASGKVVLMK